MADWITFRPRIFEPFHVPNPSASEAQTALPKTAQTGNHSRLLPEAISGLGKVTSNCRESSSRCAQDSNDSLTPLIYMNNFSRFGLRLNRFLQFLIQSLHSLNQNLHRLIQKVWMADVRSSELDSIPSGIQPLRDGLDPIRCSGFGSATEPIRSKTGIYRDFGLKGPGGALVISAVTSSPVIAKMKVSQNPSI
jgi:hypothetical protein